MRVAPAPLASPIALTVLAAIGSAVLAPVRTASAQCSAPTSSNEAKLLAFYAAPMMFTPAATPAPSPPWSVSLGAEAAYIPDPSAGIRRSNYCNAKGENTELSPVFPRPRVALALPFGLALEASYLPPVAVAGATPDVWSLALGESRQLAASVRGGTVWLSARVHVTQGTVRGAITCAESALQTSDSTASCYGTSESKDTFRPNMGGVDGTVSWTSASGRVGWYGGGGLMRLWPEFRVGFTDQRGVTDRTLITVARPLSRGVAYVGGSYTLAVPVQLSAQLFTSPADLTTLRVSAMYLLR